MSDFDRHANRYQAALDRSLAMSGDTSEYFVRYKAEYVDRLLGSGRRKILDFGCGIGLLSAAIADLRPDDCVHGFDVSRQSLDLVEAKLRARGVFTSDLEELQADYDMIVVANVMHHVPPASREQTIQDLASRLAPGGTLLIIEHNPLNPATRWVVAHCEFDDDAVLLWPGELGRYFAHAGLTRGRMDYVLFFPRFLSRLRSIEPKLRWCPFGAQYAISATR